MDPVTHLLFGANLGRAGLNRTTGLATLTLAVAAEFPDIDVVLLPFNRVEAFAHHRGMTHTLLGAPFVAAAALAVVYGLHRWRKARGRPSADAPRWWRLYGYAVLATLSHIFLDYTNNYGVRPFAPFHPRWYSWDIVSIVEPVLLLVLVAGLGGPWLLDLIGAEIGARREKFASRAPAVLALILVAGLWWGRDHEHRRAMSLLASAYGNEAVRMSAYPYPLNPFAWHGVIETEDHFLTVPVDTLSDKVDRFGTGVSRSKPEETEATLAAKRSRLGRVYLDWAAYPYVEAEVHTDGSATVTFSDLRFGYPRAQRWPLRMAVELDSHHRVIEQSTSVPEPD